mgnify:CR=1 FL=1
MQKSKKSCYLNCLILSLHLARKRRQWTNISPIWFLETKLWNLYLEIFLKLYWIYSSNIFRQVLPSSRARQQLLWKFYLKILHLCPSYNFRNLGRIHYSLVLIHAQKSLGYQQWSLGNWKSRWEGEQLKHCSYDNSLLGAHCLVHDHLHPFPLVVYSHMRIGRILQKPSEREYHTSGTTNLSRSSGAIGLLVS